MLDGKLCAMLPRRLSRLTYAVVLARDELQWYCLPEIVLSIWANFQAFGKWKILQNRTLVFEKHLNWMCLGGRKLLRREPVCAFASTWTRGRDGQMLTFRARSITTLSTDTTGFILLCMYCMFCLRLQIQRDFNERKEGKNKINVFPGNT